MSLIRNGYAVSARERILGVLFAPVLALASFHPGAATAQEVKQIKLTEKQIQGFMGAYKDMAKLYDGADLDKPDPKAEAQADAIAKRNGFASLADYDIVSTNITMIMSGIDPADQEVHRASRTNQKGYRGDQGRQVRFGGRKERGFGTA